MLMLPTAYVRELVYSGEATRFISDRWPVVLVDDARDMVHDDRFQVTVFGATEDDFYPVVMAEGWSGCCLGFELMIRLPERLDDAYRWLEMAKAIAP